MVEIIKFGVTLPSYGIQANRLPIVDTANLAESLRFDSVWLTDHLALPRTESDRFPRLFEAIATLGYLAGVTRHIRLGISALVLPQRHPFEVARAIATVDVLSGGRTLLAVGIGWCQGEYQNLGYNFHNRGRRMDEAVKVLRTCWRGREVVSFQGEFYHFEQAYFSPLPLQEGGPPLWVAGNSPAALRRAMNLADGWHPTQISAPDLKQATAQFTPFVQARPFTVCCRLRLSFQDSASAQLCGGPAKVIDQLNIYRIAGMNYALLHFEGDSQAARQRAMEVFASEVAPAFA
ncbi:MAG TPA: TIGR03619 family F420-dependent LLM class oxidoreductase [Levilinea sp.]|nr:TIGR03619 family F420-dependent LLM class oxidoreductase [Levilinea sp.]